MIRIFLIFSALTSLYACSQQPVKSTPSPDTADVVQPIATESQHTHIHPKFMFELMVGEMLVQKGDLEGAFDLIFSVAEQTHNLELIERAFHLSMNTYNVENIDKTAKLWREISPDEPTAWRVGYLMSLRKGDVEQALQHWQDYRAHSNVSLEDDLKNTAAQAVQSTSPETGMAFFEALYQRYPSEWAAGYAYSYAADQYQQPELAADVLEKTIQLPDVPSEVYFALANLYVENDMVERGLSQLAKYVKSNPTDWSVQERYARLEVKAERYESARKRYLRIVEHNPDAHTSKLSLALLHLERGEMPQAKSLLESLVNQDGYQDVSHYYLGVIAQSQQQFRVAEHHLQQVSHPNYMLDSQLLVSQIRFETDGLREAIEHLDAIQLVDDETKIKVWRAKGIFYSHVKDYARAAEFYRQAYEVSDESLTLSYSLAMALYELKSFQEYDELLTSVVAKYPDEPEALNALAYYYVEQEKNLPQAEKMLDHALTLSPNSFHILDSRGWLAYKLKNYIEAERYIEQAWALKKDDEILIHLIKTKWALKKHNEARKLWNQHHKDYPENKQLQNLMLKLSR